MPVAKKEKTLLKNEIERELRILEEPAKSRNNISKSG